MFIDRQQFHMGIAHVLDIFHDLVRHLPETGKLIALRLAPGAQMQLIDGHGRREHVLFRPAAHIGRVFPFISFDIPDLGSGIRANLRVKREGVALQNRISVISENAVFVVVSVSQAPDKARPDPVVFLHGIGLAVPAVEVADDADVPCIGRPNAEAVHTDLFHIVAPKGQIGPLRLADIE